MASIKMKKAKVKMLLNQIFFATILVSTPQRERSDIPTAATDMKTIFYNPEFVDKWDVDQIVFLLAHEVMHIALLHGVRMGGRNPTLWNIACDYAINEMLDRSGMKLIPGVMRDRQYDGMAAEEIYDKLLKQSQEKKQSLCDEFTNGPIGEDLQSGPVDAEEVAKIEQTVKQHVAAAATMARAVGKLPGHIEAFVDGLINPQIPWQIMLREFMTQTIHAEESWSRRNRRFSSVVLPSKHSLGMGEIVVIGDVSGSVSDEELNAAAAEIFSIADLARPERLRVLWADTEVQREEVFEVGDTVSLHPLGRGGTDMRVPLAHAAQYDPEVVVLITDGETPWPTEEPPYPLIVVCTTKVDVPFGRVVRM